MKPLVSWLVTGAIAAVAVMAVILARQRTARLRLELADREQHAAAALEAHRRSLTQVAAATAQADRLRELSAERLRLTAEAAQLETALRESTQPGPASAPPEQVTLNAAEWKNSGCSTPQAAVETALWAAAGGDVDALAGTLLLAGDARAAAERLLNKLSASQRAEYANPERLVALFAARELMNSAATARLLTESDDADASVRVRLRNDAGATQIGNLSLRHTADGWRIVVSTAAVSRYGRLLAGAGNPTR